VCVLQEEEVLRQYSVSRDRLDELLTLHNFQLAVVIEKLDKEIIQVSAILHWTSHCSSRYRNSLLQSHSKAQICSSLSSLCALTGLDTKDCPLARDNQTVSRASRFPCKLARLTTKYFGVFCYLTHWTSKNIFRATCSNLILARRTSGSKS
jgi:hypothetical protein